jgi:hypothetical protein
MFADAVNPSAEGIWTRVAPYLALTAIIAAFCLALAVVISAIETSHYLTTKLPNESPTIERPTP